MIQKPIVPPPVIFIGCALMMAYLPNPYPFEINVLAVYLIVSISFVIAFSAFGNSIKVKQILIQFTWKKVMCLWQMVFIVSAVTQCI